MFLNELTWQINVFCVHTSTERYHGNGLYSSLLSLQEVNRASLILKCIRDIVKTSSDLRKLTWKHSDESSDDV